MAKTEITFKIAIYFKEAFITAIEHVNQNEKSGIYRSDRSGEITYKEIKPRQPHPAHYWFEVTASRPFLIFALGEKYQLNL